MSGVVILASAGQEFGIPALDVRDVLRRQAVTPIPLAPRGIAGLLNLRGRIVTAIDLRIRLGLPPLAGDSDATLVVVEHRGELYALVVDGVGDVVALDEQKREPLPPTLDPRWRAMAAAVYPTRDGLIVLLEIARLLDFAPAPVRRAAS